MNTIIYSMLLALFIFAGNIKATAQTGQTAGALNTSDSLALETVIWQVLATHPSVLKAEEAIKIADAGIGMAKTAYLPNIDFEAGYTRIGPVPAISIPGAGSFKMAPADILNSGINVAETVYDFSKTDKNIKLKESDKQITAAGLDLLKQRLALSTAVNYYALVYYQEALKIKNIQISTLKQHLDFVTRKNETGSATKYEILSTQVRLSAAESQLVDIETARKNTLTVLNSLLGLPSNTILKVKSVLPQPLQHDSPDQMVDFAYGHRSEMTIANLKEQHAQLSMSAVKVQNYPVVSAFTSGGFKNGYFPDLNKLKANYVAGLSVRVPLFSASRQKYSLLMAGNEVNMSQLDQQQVKRDIASEVYQNDATLQAAVQKISQSELQVRQAEEARALAEVSYKSGSILNLDLLDSETLEAESQLNLLKAQSEYNISLFRLDISLGKLVY